MKPAVVVDVGNSRMKWGRCSADAVAEVISLPLDQPEAWATHLTSWHLPKASVWVVTGVQPERRDQLIDWLRQQGQEVRLLEHSAQIPLRTHVDRPDYVGIDRLLNGVAANAWRQPGRPAIVADAGSAVTVDWLDAEGYFCGGTIFPGLRLMTQSLHDYTALLPLVEIRTPQPTVPATSTTPAIAAGVYWAVVGGIIALTDQMAQQSAHAPDLFLTGGDASLLAPALPKTMMCRHLLTLEGIRLSVEPLP